jgi:rare lipoprotein A
MNRQKKFEKVSFSTQSILALALFCGTGLATININDSFAAIAFDKTYNIPVQGKASWIGERFQGKKTASGELFDINDLTASHATLPFGTKVKVTSQKTKKSVVVRVNNRSEVDNGRIIDLSKRAAEQIGLVEEGVGVVNLEVVSAGPNKEKETAPVKTSSPVKTTTVTTTTTTLKTSEVASKPSSEAASSTAAKYQIQFASFFDLDNAVEFKEALKKKGISSSVDNVQSSDRTVYRVNSEQKYASKAEAKEALAQYAPQEGTVVSVTTGQSQGFATTEKQPATQKPAEVAAKAEPVKATIETKEVPPKAVSKPNNTAVKPKVANSNYEYGVQFGAFETADYAKDLQSKLLVDKGIRTIIHQFPDDDKKFFRVLTNHSFSSREESDKFLKEAGVQGTILTFTK